MSVIAKFMLRDVTDYGMGRLSRLSVICENDLMAAYAKDHNDKLFTRYSPAGEIAINHRDGWTLGQVEELGNIAGNPPAPAYYVMLLGDDEAPDPGTEEAKARHAGAFPGAFAVCQVQCFSRTSFAGDTVRVEFRELQARDEHKAMFWRSVDRLNWKMSVDNPAASDQFKPGQSYWCAFYPAGPGGFTYRQAIESAHAGRDVRFAETADAGA